MILFEILLLFTVLAMAGLASWHSLTFRPREQTVLLATTGIGFGYVFPLIDVNVLHQYAFRGVLTFLNLPVHLGFAWYGLLYMALALAEHLAGPARWRVALVAGLVFGVLETQWDPTLLHLGIMELRLPSFAAYPASFNPGVPMAHAYFGFAYAYAASSFRRTPRPWLSRTLVLATLVAWPLGMMALVPLFQPIYRWGAGHFSAATLVLFDALHFSSSFVCAALGVALWLRVLARWLGAAEASA